MLETIKKCIENQSELAFDDYYLNYVNQVQDNILNREVRCVADRVLGFSGLRGIEEELNQLTDELFK